MERFDPWWGISPFRWIQYFVCFQYYAVGPKFSAMVFKTGSRTSRLSIYATFLILHFVTRPSILDSCAPDSRARCWRIFSRFARFYPPPRVSCAPPRPSVVDTRLAWLLRLSVCRRTVAGIRFLNESLNNKTEPPESTVLRSVLFRQLLLCPYESAHDVSSGNPTFRVFSCIGKRADYRQC